MQGCGDSSIQKVIERSLKLRYLKENGLTENPELLFIGEYQIHPDINCYDAQGHQVIGEIYVHEGKLRPGQRKKIASDILKLIAYKHSQNIESINLIYLIPDNLQIGEASWLFKTMEILKISIFKVRLLDDELTQLRVGVATQRKGNIAK